MTCGSEINFSRLRAFEMLLYYKFTMYTGRLFALAYRSIIVVTALLSLTYIYVN